MAIKHIKYEKEISLQPGNKIEYYYFYNDKRMSEKEALYCIETNSWSPNAFKLDQFEYAVFEEMITNFLDQKEEDAFKRGQQSMLDAGYHL
jgi:hypothetical protein